MIRYIKGVLEYRRDGDIIVESNGIGYLIHVPMSIYNLLPSVGELVKIHTYLYVREDAMILYGFLSDDDLFTFEKLISVNGIGPKGALGLLSTLTTDELRLAIVNEDDKMIAKAPGIGKKTAQRLIIDLKDKLDLTAISNAIDSEIAGVSNNTDDKQEAISALVSLGYTSTEATRVINKIKDFNSVEDLIKKGLKALAIL